MPLLEKLRELHTTYNRFVVHNEREPDNRFELDRDTRDALERAITVIKVAI